jgi:tRNA-specific 2-thiouridylase
MTHEIVDTRQKKALIAMSGGVDSSVAAYLTKKQGFVCLGATMKLFSNNLVGIEREKTCCSLADVEDARSVAFQLDMPFRVLNFTDTFKTEVINRFIDAYQNGWTPNPCIDCNRYLKFDRLFLRLKEINYDYIVTGHYARIERDAAAGRYLLRKAADDTKDQSYVLYAMTQNQLAHTMFPLGGLRKSQVREIALANGFINAKKRDSQDICFVPDGDYAQFIERMTGNVWSEGDVTDVSGKLLGRHKGIIRYTIGQRKGLGIALLKPYYVCDKIAETNTVVLGEESDLNSKTLEAGDVNLIACEQLTSPVRVTAKVRYKQKEEFAVAEQIAPDRLRITFDIPQKAIARGQAVVLYDGDVVLGGGTILSASR